MDNVAKLKALLEDEFNRSTARELEMPDGMAALTLTMDAEAINPDWKGFTLEFSGDRQPPPSRELDYIYAESEGMGIRVWRLRIRRDGVQAYIEARTRPGWYGYNFIDLKNLDPFDRGGNGDMLTLGLAMLYPRYLRSRPLGSGRFASAEEFDADYERVLADLRRENIKPTRPIIAYRLGVSVRTFDKYKGQYTRSR